MSMLRRKVSLIKVRMFLKGSRWVNVKSLSINNSDSSLEYLDYVTDKLRSKVLLLGNLRYGKT